MKKLTVLVGLFLMVLSACKKDEILPLKPNPKNSIIACKNCEGSWDLTEPIR